MTGLLLSLPDTIESDGIKSEYQTESGLGIV